jgi:protein-S-isoprenylcysteine O-methyltransferase Ste14
MPSLIVFSAWVLFGGSHLVLSSSKLRQHLEGRLNAFGFTVLFVSVTTITMTALILACAVYADQGMPGPGIGRSGVLGWIVQAASFGGAVLMIAGLLNYPNSPFAGLANRARRRAQRDTPLATPNGLERVTRHPFFVGLSVFSIAQAIQATTLASSIYFAGFAVTSLLGIYFQDRKLRHRWPEEYGKYEAQTGSMLSLSKAKNARQPWITWFSAVIFCATLFVWLRPVWTYANGAMFGVCILGFGVLATVATLAKYKRKNHET